MSTALPRSLDVQISVTRAQTELRTNLSVLCVVVPYHSGIADTVRLYTDSDSVGTDWGSTSSAAKAAEAFFAQTPNAGTLAIGQVSSTFSTDIAAELATITAAAKALGTNIYGWCLAQDFRTASLQEAAATWALAHTAMMPLVTNDANALDPAYTTDIGSVIKAAGNRRAPCLYHPTADLYPDVSILAYMLSVNYALQDSTVTAKFKQLPGITTVDLTDTQWAALKAKGYNTYTFIGNSSRTYREGTTEDASYFMDSVINLDNFVEDLSVAVFNVFLRNKKVPYTRKGQMLLVDACKEVGNQYVYNGTFADRLVADTSQKSGYSTVPAVQVVPTPIYQMSDADRAGRVGPPIQMIVQEAGAIHSVAISVEVVE